MTSAKKDGLAVYISLSLPCHLTFTTLPDVRKQSAGRRRKLHLDL